MPNLSENLIQDCNPIPDFHDEMLKNIRAYFIQKYPTVMFSDETVQMLVEFRGLSIGPEWKAIDLLIEVMAGKSP